MNVKVEYLLKKQKGFTKVEIPYEEYFEIEPGEVLSIDSVPRYSQPYDYIDVSIKEISVLKLFFEINSEGRVFKQTFWNNGNNILTERIDFGAKNYREIILSFKIDEINNTYETLRLQEGDDFIFPTYHGIFHSDDNGADIEHRFDTDGFDEIIR